MVQLAGKPASYWVESSPGSQFPQLPGGASADVAIVGAGMVGLTVALLLKRAGRTVAVIESRKVGEQVTGHTTAKITSLHSLIYADLIKSFGEEKARLYGEANQAAIEHIASLIAEHNIACDFERKAAYTYSQSGRRLTEVEAEVQAAVKLGLPASFVRETTLPFPIQGAIRFDHQAQFHPLKYLLSLAQAIPGDGSQVFERTRVLDVEEGNPCRVITDRGVVTAHDVIVATNLPILDRGGFFAKAFPRRHPVLAARIAPEKAPDGMFISTEEPSHSVRTQRHNDSMLLIAVGGGYKTGHADTEQVFRELEVFVRAHFDIEVIEYRWGNQDYDSMDRVPYVGKLTPGSKHIYVATGFGAWGMTNGTAAAVVLCDAILGRPNPWAGLYDATRVNPTASAKTFLGQNLHVAKEWVGGRLTDRPSVAPVDLAPGEGTVAKMAGEMLAIYKDEQGALHAVSAVCTHMRCIVRWNSAERSWDCPCHGSRFSVDGSVIHGPTVRDLKRKTVAEQ